MFHTQCRLCGIVNVGDKESDEFDCADCGNPMLPMSAFELNEYHQAQLPERAPEPIRDGRPTEFVTMVTSLLASIELDDAKRAEIIAAAGKPLKILRIGPKRD